MKLRALGLGSIAALLLSASPAAAYDGFDVQNLHPNASQRLNGFGVGSAQIQAARQWELGLMLHYADDLLGIYDGDEQKNALVHDQLVTNVLFSVGIADRLEIGFDVPMILRQTGDNVPNLDFNGHDAGVGIADPRIIPKLQLFNGDTSESPGGVSLALEVGVFLPLGNVDTLQGEDLRVHPRLLFDVAFAEQFRLMFNAGYMVRTGSGEIANLQVDDVITYGAGIDIALGAEKAGHLLLEFEGAVSALADSIDREELPIEARIGGRYIADRVHVGGGFGMGLLRGFGAPDWRFMLEIGVSSVGCDDCDEDGVLNANDLCPADAEDHDDFEDTDGCPDPDNDGDGILDFNDTCPLQAEDNDGFEDADGCPDIDNDGDRIDDEDDDCPDIAEDIDGFEDMDGCPDLDNDGDGVLDIDDDCPDSPEDFDGFEDADGCPESDNDRDGMLDADDACPELPEDYDGFEDDDGCPEEGEGLVSLQCDRIEIAENVYFETSSAEIEARSFELLNQVATVLRSANQIRRVRVEGHTDDRGSDDSNLTLSQERAESVRTYLENQGVRTSVDAVGFGETRPIADNDSRSGRAQNRRVEFHIVEQDTVCAEGE